MSVPEEINQQIRDEIEAHNIEGILSEILFETGISLYLQNDKNQLNFENILNYLQPDALSYYNSLFNTEFDGEPNYLSLSAKLYDFIYPTTFQPMKTSVLTIKQEDLPNLLDNNVACPNMMRIELYKNSYCYVYFTTLDDKYLKDAFDWMWETSYNYIIYDLEWKPDSPKVTNKIALFQFSSFDRVLIIRNTYIVSPEIMNNGLDIVRSFVLSHTLIGKGIGCDLQKFDITLNIHTKTQATIYDFAELYLKPNNLSENFNKMVEQFTCLKSTVDFKQKKVSRSNWTQKVYTWKMLLYSINDVYILGQCFYSSIRMYPDALSYNAKLQ